MTFYKSEEYVYVASTTGQIIPMPLSRNVIKNLTLGFWK